MPKVVSFQRLKMVDGVDEVAALWVPEVAALCEKCMDGVHSGEPLERPDGKANHDSTEEKEAQAIGFGAPSEATNICTCASGPKQAERAR